MKTTLMTCLRGHALAGSNLYIWPRTGKRVCRSCQHLRSRRNREKIRARTKEKRQQKIAAWLKPLPDTELAWAAGLFEGEGTVTISSGGRKNYTRTVISMTNTDKEVVDYFCDRWPGLISSPKKQAEHHRQKWVWNICCLKAEAFIRQILPFIRTRRVREKMELALEAESAREKGAHDPLYTQKCREYHARMRALNKRGC